VNEPTPGATTGARTIVTGTQVGTYTVNCDGTGVITRTLTASNGVTTTQMDDFIIMGAIATISSFTPSLLATGLADAILFGEGTDRIRGSEDTIIRVPTFVIWGMKDTALLTGNLSGLDKWVPNLSVKLYPYDDHWVMIEKGKEVAQDIRQFIEAKDFPKDSAYRGGTRR